MKDLIEHVAGRFPEGYYELLAQISTKTTFEKDAVILAEGKPCKSLWFIEEGAVKAFENMNGVERTTYFFIEQMFFTNYYCWVTGNVSDITFKAVEPSEIIVIDYPSLEQLCVQYHFFDTVGRKMAERQFVYEFQLRKLLLNYTALERYEYLEQQQPHIFQRFALKDIASFIGITDVSLSRLRKERKQKNR